MDYDIHIVPVLLIYCYCILISDILCAILLFDFVHKELLASDYVIPVLLFNSIKFTTNYDFSFFLINFNESLLKCFVLSYDFFKHSTSTSFQIWLSQKYYNYLLSLPLSRLHRHLYFLLLNYIYLFGTAFRFEFFNIFPLLFQKILHFEIYLILFLSLYVIFYLFTSLLLFSIFISFF